MRHLHLAEAGACVATVGDENEKKAVAEMAKKKAAAAVQRDKELKKWIRLGYKDGDSVNALFYTLIVHRPGLD